MADLGAEGLRMFPLGRGKVPAVKDWPNVASSHPEAVRILALKCHGTTAYGVVLDDARLVVIDIDVPKPGKEDRADGNATWLDVQARAGVAAPATFTVRTASGGLQLWFARPAETYLSTYREFLGVRGGRNTDTWPSVDVLAAGYVVMPGSVVEVSGEGWTMRCGYTIEHVAPPAELPAAILRLLVEDRGAMVKAGLLAGARRGEHQPSASQGLQITRETVAEALRALPPIPDIPGRRAPWLRVLFAVKGSCPDAAEEFISWSVRGGGDAAAVEREWNKTVVDYANPATLANLLQRDAPDVAMAIREEINIALARRLESMVE